jgi:hypothetical protein
MTGSVLDNAEFLRISGEKAGVRRYDPTTCESASADVSLSFRPQTDDVDKNGGCECPAS